MTDAEKAYAKAEEMIAKVLKTGGNRLDFDSPEMHALEVLPPQITDLKMLRHLDCDNTQISDVTPLSDLTGLTALWLSDTRVSDVTALFGLTGLTMLELNNTSVSDVMPLSSLTDLTGLSLEETPVSDVTALSGLTGLTQLWLSGTSVSDVTPLSGLTGLTALLLDRTSVSDVTPLSSLTGLTELGLAETSVSDVTPLAGLTGLTTLSLYGTPVSDLRPLLGLSGLVDDPKYGGLIFQGCVAAQNDARIAQISEVEDAAERARALFEYLEDWVPVGEGGTHEPVPDSLFNVVSHGERLEVAASVPSEAERDERLKQVLHEQLQARSKALAQQAGNQFFRLSARARGLVDQVDKEFAELDVLMLHLAIEDLRAMEALGREDDESGDFPPEVMVALSDVLRLGPGLTLGNADVDLLVERANARRLADPVPEAETQAQDAMSDALAGDEAAIGENLIGLSKDVSGKDDAEHRETQKAANRNVLWRLAVGTAAVIGAVATGVTVNVFTPPVTEFVTANWPTLLSTAQTYGTAFVEWFLVSMGNVSEFAGLVASSPDRRAIETRRED